MNFLKIFPIRVEIKYLSKDRQKEILETQRLALSGAIAEEVWNHPVYGIEFKKLVKKALPKANIPELDVVE